MLRVKPVIFLAIILFLSSLLFACTDQDHTEIRFQAFPDSYQQYDRMPWEMLEFKPFVAAYEKNLDDFPSDQYMDTFISEICIVSTGNRFVTTKQGNFIFMVGCKPHCCTETRLFILFDPKKNRVWANVFDFGVTGKFDIWLGHPDEKTRKLIVTLESMVSGV